MTDAGLSTPASSEIDWKSGEDISAAELLSRYEIPREESESFRSSIRIYQQRDTIIREGDTDKTLFLLRHGIVTVYKTISQDTREHIGIIKAVNFFGEMSLLNDNPRSATIEAFSDEVVVYAVDRPKVSMLLANPHWAEMLLTRISKDLAHTNNQLASALQSVAQMKKDKEAQAEELKRAEEERKKLVRTVFRVFNVLVKFQTIIQKEAIVGSRGWGYLQALNRLTSLLIQRHLPEVAAQRGASDDVMLRSALVELGDSEPKAKTIYQTLLDQLEK